MWFIFGEHIARGSLIFYFDYLIFYKSVKNGVNYKTKTLQNISKFYWSLGKNRPSSKTCSKLTLVKVTFCHRKIFYLGVTYTVTKKPADRYMLKFLIKKHCNNVMIIALYAEA